MGCVTFGCLGKDADSKPVKKRFIFMFQVGGKTIGFTPTGSPHHINEPITKIYKGMAYTYLCTDRGDVYSTNKLEVFEKGGETK